MRILLFDNIEGFHELSAICSKKQVGFSFFHFEDVHDVIARLKNPDEKEKSFDLLLLNPACSKNYFGDLEVLLGNNAPLPLVLLLSQLNDPLIKESFARGVQDYLYKEEIGHQLANRIFENAVERHKRIKTESKRSVESANFLYRVSHDLKGPIITLNGLVQLAQKKVTDPTAVEYLEKIGIGTKKLETLIASLLELTISRKGEPKAELITTREFLDELLSVFEINAKEIKVRKILGTDSIVADKTMLFYTLKNLVENAIKYRRKEIQTEIEISFSESKNGYCVSVKDNGQGIESRFLPHIFDMFYRANETSAGSGLGLYNSRTFVTKMKGNIGVESISGKGTTVKINLPFVSL